MMHIVAEGNARSSSAESRGEKAPASTGRGGQAPEMTDDRESTVQQERPLNELPPIDMKPLNHG